jgi:DNA polymerase III sliding clamp (beta) subunit (PCNA family)
MIHLNVTELLNADLILHETKIPEVYDANLPPFPNVDEVIPDPTKYLAENTFTVGLNAEYLLDIVKAMQDNPKQKHVKLVFNTIDNKNAILVYVGEANGSRALLMPVRV